MQILLVDDEALARQRLKNLLDELGSDYELAGEAGNGKDAVIFCSRHEVDVVLMDIHMPGMGGLEAATELAAQEMPPAVIFTTAYSQHALSAFHANAADYLLKPIRREKLQRALEKAARPTRLQASSMEGAENDYLVARSRNGLERILVADVYYLQADNKYVVARHKRGELLLEESLKSLEQRLGDRFLRVHRSTLVALDKIRGLEKTADGGYVLPLMEIDDTPEVSRRHLKDVRKALT